MRYKVQFVPIPFGTLAVITAYSVGTGLKLGPVRTLMIPDEAVDADDLGDLVSYLAADLASSPL